MVGCQNELKFIKNVKWKQNCLLPTTWLRMYFSPNNENEHENVHENEWKDM